MDKPVLKDSMRLFEQFGQVKSRSMFGGFGIFVDDTMFALVVKNQLHLRADDQTAQRFTEQGYQPYVYKKRGFPVVTKYFAFPDFDLSGNVSLLLKEAELALNNAKAERQQQVDTKPTRLKDLPNLRLATERMLKKAGIHSVEDLQRKGAVAAFQAIRQNHSSELNLELLWALEGAIEGKHWSVISHRRREELKRSIC